YLTDSMNYIPVSLENQANPHAGASKVTNSASTSQTLSSNASEEKDEDVELIGVPSTVKTTEEKSELRISSKNSKKEEILTEPQQAKKVSSTDTLEDNPTILAFRKELEEIVLKHLGKVSENTSTSTPSVNIGSAPVNTGSFDPDDSPMPELEIFHKSETRIFDEVSYDEEGVITDFNSLPTKIEHAQEQMFVDDLLQLVPQLMTRVDSLEKDLKQTKLTMGSAIVKLVKKVKKLEDMLKRKNVVFSDSEEEEPEDQGRKSQDDPQVSLVQGLVTPSKSIVNISGEEQVEDISPNTLEAAKTLSRVASQKPKSIDKGRRYKRRKETKGKKSIPSFDKGQREGKAPMIIEEAPKKTKEQILQEEASLAEAIRLDTLEKEEEAKQVHLDSLLAQRIAEKEEFDKLVKQVESFAPINFEATKDSLKRFGEELQTKTSKILKSDEAKDEESIKKTGKRRKKMLILFQEDGTDIVYINFGAMLKDITRDDLTKLYRIVMNRYNMNGLEDELEK
ncbi:hypothetical protein Tco_1026140, partial [Tanacetum coccineum]